MEDPGLSSRLTRCQRARCSSRWTTAAWRGACSVGAPRGWSSRRCSGVWLPCTVPASIHHRRADADVDAAGGPARAAAVKNDQDMRTAGGDTMDEIVDLLVREVAD